MEARELRLGNLIRDIETQRIGTVLTISKHPVRVQLEYSKLTQRLYEYEGIPLDEEWLKKINLVSVGGDFVRFNKLRCFLLKRDNSGYYYGLPNNSMRTEVKFVHQLQNLYFALTGEELTFKTEDNIGS